MGHPPPRLLSRNPGSGAGICRVPAPHVPAPEPDFETSCALGRPGHIRRWMQKDIVAAVVKGVMPTANGCAVFLGNDEKTFVIYVDHFVGNAIQMTLNGVKKERPLTHDLIGSMFLGLGARLDHVVVNDAREGTFFARIFLRMENELGKKIVEIDARPSDSIVLALQQKRPIFVVRAVFDQVDDMTEILDRVLKQQQEEQESEGEEPAEGEEPDEPV